MPRIDHTARRARSRQQRKAAYCANRRNGVKIPGAYSLLLEQERVYGKEPDPRWWYCEAGKRGDPYPESARGPALLLPAMEAGEPVKVCSRRLSRLLTRAGELGPYVMPQQPEGRVEWFFWKVWQDRSFGVLLVHADDTVVPMRRT
ncbi:hypothetical protein VIMS_04932 [Mycobacterium marinum]|uniref:hypothetical protein n=1 Tax=Mycobacterium marinum TaxID=1781 RepID=UPI000EEA1778|nr:hypothetical protein [Mycobacterium marinum]RFZ05430.1 hypothetical protein VIMS_04932 [Mycobacterium marinum]